MSSLFITGNGFDIAHGIPTTYGDFRNYVIDQYPEAITLRNEVVYLNDLLDIDPIAFSAEILLNAMDKAAGENWSNFEEALATISFNAKLPKPNHKENETEEEDHELMSQYLLYMDMLTSAFIKCSSYWQILFSKWIRSIQDKIEKHQFLPKENLKALLSNNDMLFSRSTIQRLCKNYMELAKSLISIIVWDKSSYLVMEMRRLPTGKAFICLRKKLILPHLFWMI